MTIFRGVWEQWLDRRIPRSDEHNLNRSNIFILPTAQGVMFMVVLFISLLTGINYQNSLIYLFTFIMGTVFYGTILQTFQNLSDLKVVFVSAEDTVAGQPMPLAVRLAIPEGQVRLAMTLTAGDRETEVGEVRGHQSAPVTLLVPTRRRGPVRCPRIKLETWYPFGLIRAWTWLQPLREGVATPVPVEPPPSASDNAAPEGEEEQTQRRQAGMEDMRLRPYRAGDSLQRVRWKTFAQSGQMIVSDWEEPAGNPFHVSWNDYPAADPELRLSYLAWRVNELSVQQKPFTLELPGQFLGPDTGESFRIQCQRALGLFNHARDGEVSR